jgi:hypothetical protein
MRGRRSYQDVPIEILTAPVSQCPMWAASFGTAPGIEQLCPNSLTQNSDPFYRHCNIVTKQQQHVNFLFTLRYPSNRGKRYQHTVLHFKVIGSAFSFLWMDTGTEIF